MTLQPIIGLEIHIRLNTKSKMFCRCSNAGEDAPPNTAICEVCTGQPGVLPVINERAIESAIRMGLAMNCQIPNHSKFDRKNYFYPDLPKGYQISQYDEPVVKTGFIDTDIPSSNGTYTRRIRITRLHLEEDAAKLLHASDAKSSYVDFNRSGVPLMEIVTEPDFRSPLEAKQFLQELQRIARTIGIANADMEKGHMRCDANISLLEVGNGKSEVRGRTVRGTGTADEPLEDIITDYSALSAKTEIKNLNSFRAVERALEYEIERQTKLWEAGTPVSQQSTRGWNDGKGVTELQRTKEFAHDYRYFPEPDLPPITVTDETIQAYKAQLPELPRAKRMRFMNEYGFNAEDARLLTDNVHVANYTEEVMSELREWMEHSHDGSQHDDAVFDRTKQQSAKLVGGWIGSKLFGILNAKGVPFNDMKITAENFAELLTFIATHRVNSTNALVLLETMVETGADPAHILEERNLEQVSDVGTLETEINTVVNEHANVVKDFLNGKTAALMFLVGQVMRRTKGKADPTMIKKMLEEKLKK